MENVGKQRGNLKGPTSAVVADRVRSIRQARRMDLAALSDSLDLVGWSIPVAALSRLENGKRRIDVDDLLALAVALDVSPLELIFPAHANELDVIGTALPTELITEEVWAWGRESVKSLKRPKALRDYWAKMLEQGERELAEIESMPEPTTDAVRDMIARNRRLTEGINEVARDRRSYWEQRLSSDENPDA